MDEVKLHISFCLRILCLPYTMLMFLGHSFSYVRFQSLVRIPLNTSKAVIHRYA
ncbi:hypothetical protein KIN20_033141 [Parelaphostrongylus tenuis]|uniref:Uncharacterized protein n=1 Tax=Parelaphostrongylus tenuis TaxID=148309 RepID=A0AAD5R859_PARTN|nr:hypothetical protein KIN20_033141 [Parelaphostrongylus tenuis]